MKLTRLYPLLEVDLLIVHHISEVVDNPDEGDLLIRNDNICVQLHPSLFLHTMALKDLYSFPSSYFQAAYMPEPAIRGQ
jgi:hypothetical protein